MRYESFYPFARNQSPPMRQPNFNPNMFMQPGQNQGPPPNLGPQRQPFSNNIPGQSGGQGPSKLETYMQTADRFLNTAQQYAPLVQQFAPMINNLPAMWRLYKGFQSMPNTGGSASAGQAASNAAQSAASSAARSATQATGPRPSVPRIFQPPSP